MPSAGSKGKKDQQCIISFTDGTSLRCSEIHKDNLGSFKPSLRVLVEVMLNGVDNRYIFCRNVMYIKSTWDPVDFHSGP